MHSNKDLKELFSGPKDIDETDFEIICFLETHGKKKIKEMAEEIGISASNLSNRLNRLENEGLVKGFYPLFNHDQLGFTRSLIALIQTDPKRSLEEINRDLIHVTGVKTLKKIIGEYDLYLEVCCVGDAELEAIIDEITKVEGIQRISKHIVARNIKSHFLEL